MDARELIRAIAKDCGAPHDIVRDVVASFAERVVEALAAGQAVPVQGLGHLVPRTWHKDGHPHASILCFPEQPVRDRLLDLAAKVHRGVRPAGTDVPNRTAMAKATGRPKEGRDRARVESRASRAKSREGKR